MQPMMVSVRWVVVNDVERFTVTQSGLTHTHLMIADLKHHIFTSQGMLHNLQSVYSDLLVKVKICCMY